MKYFSRILVPTDFSKSSLAALGPAEAIAKQFRSKLYLLHVAEELPVYAFNIGLSQEALEERMVDLAAADLRKAAKKLKLNGAELIIRTGSVKNEILQVVKEKKIDLVVMGTTGRSGLEQALLGSVASTIVRSAPCQVLTVKPRKK